MQTEHYAPEAQIPLSRLLAESRTPSTPLAQSNGHIFSWGDFRLDVASLSSQILEIGCGRWLLFTEDTYRFAVGLFAIWHADSIAVLPPNLGQQTLKELNHELQGVVTDCKLELDNVPLLYPKAAVTHALHHDWEVLSRHQTKLEIFTSELQVLEKRLKKQSLTSNPRSRNKKKYGVKNLLNQLYIQQFPTSTFTVCCSRFCGLYLQAEYFSMKHFFHLKS